MNTCEGCYFWHPDDSGETGNCMVEPPRVIPIMGMEAGRPKTILQNMYPTTRRDDYCRHFDQRPRPVIKVTSQIPGEN